jgi:hypothetical protein
VAVAEGQVVLAELPGAAQQVIVDIGEVLDVLHPVAEILEVAMQDVEADVGEGVAQVAGVVGRDTADVQAHRLVAEWLERATLPGARIVEAEGHQGREAICGACGAG